MKTLTPEEIIKSRFNIDDKDVQMTLSEICEVVEIYHAQFQSQPSISAEEFIGEKFKAIHFYGGMTVKLTAAKLSELLTEFASRQGKVVEIKKEDGNK